ncbi:MAG: CDP-glucose 4,6-dehydratase [Candidatus Caenarcaniphilales bacterium]|jgi:CDP-glucose 4,6-dehydratase|nr:CDP-glucose 4,6-dehydratase [Candidatus Caenarcaniphilales bacterium]
MYLNKFKNKKILITGHTGFKGSWLALWLQKLGAEVVGYALEPETKPNLFEVLNLETKVTNYFGDIRDFEKLETVIQKEKPEIIFHLAAQALVRESYKNPRKTFEVNTMGTVNLLEACRNCDSVKTIINVTTDKCYENKEWVYGYRESDALGGYDPYSASKANSEIITASYRNSFFNPQDYGNKHHVALASARAGNVIGGGDWSEDRLVPDCIKSLSQKQSILIRNPLATRPWQHVLEPLRGYLWLAAKMMDDPISYSQAWNFGPNDDGQINVEILVQKIIKNWGAGDYQIDKSIQPHEAHLLKLDLSKSKALLKYQPCLDINQCIALTVDWYKHYYDNCDMQRICLEQIKKISSYDNISAIASS